MAEQEVNPSPDGEEEDIGFSLLQKAGVFAPAALGLTGLEVFLNAPLPMEVAFIVGAGILAHKSPEIYASLKRHGVLSSKRRIPAAVAASRPAPVAEASKPTTPPSGGWSFTDKLMGKHMQSLAEPTTEPVSTRGLPTRVRAQAEAVTEKLPDDAAESNVWNQRWYEEDDTPPIVSPVMSGGKFTLSQLLASGFRPTLQKIFLARLTDGTDVYVEAKDLCHVALAGNTGNGKSSLMRLIMAQLCMVGVDVLLLNPHYMRLDRSANPPEDWTPYEPHLAQPPILCAEYAQIGFYLKWMAETLLPKRIDRARNGGAVGKPYFIVIDELPAIVDEVKEAPDYIAKILREGRKYGIYLICASQDFQVKTIGMDGGGVRKCFRTAFYVGGDMATAKALLEKTSEEIPETDLGKGVVMIRCKATRSAVLARVPYTDNEALYQMLGPSTFVNQDDDEEIAPSVPSSLSPSNTTSGNGARLRIVEGGRNSLGSGTKDTEVVMPSRALSELEQQVDALFFEKKMNPAAIVKELWPDIKGGDAYQKKSAEVAEAIRTVVEAKRGA